MYSKASDLQLPDLSRFHKRLLMKLCTCNINLFLPRPFQMHFPFALYLDEDGAYILSDVFHITYSLL